MNAVPPAAHVPAPACRWRLIPGQLAAYRQWDDEFVVYNNLSGDTHLLGIDAMQVLLDLQRRGPADTGTLAAATSADEAEAGSPTDPDNDIAAAIDAILDDLHRLALIEPVTC